MAGTQYTNGDYQYRLTADDAIEILRYTGSDSKLNVPESLDFLPVIRIGDGAFSGCRGLTNVVIGEGIRQIGERAFSGCCSLSGVNIPPSVLSIADSAFEDCPPSLVFVVRPNSAGYRWAAEKHRQIDPFSSSFLYGFHTMWPDRAVVEKYIGDEKEVVLPHELDGYPVACIWERAFKGCRSLTGIVLPEGLEDIAEEAFSHCSSLSRVVIPASVTAIGFDAFEDCAEDLTLIVEKDSYAHRWAEKMKHPYLHPDGND